MFKKYLVICLILSFSMPLKIYAENMESGYIVSMIRLIAAPEEYKNKKVSVSGVISSATNEPRLYLDEFSRSHANQSSSIPLSGKLLDKSIKTGTFVTVLGKFKILNEMVSPAGVITDIEYVFDEHGNSWNLK